MARPTLLIMGSAGSGKGTQTDLIEEQFGYHVIEAGEVWRQKMKEDNPVAEEIRKLDADGKHGSDELVKSILMEYIDKVDLTGPLLVDGYPRTIGQAHDLKDILRETGHDPDLFIAIWIKVSKEVAEERLLKRSQCSVCKTVFMSREISECPHCNGLVRVRRYDHPEAILNRLDFFWTTTMEAIDLYREEGRLIEINGEQEVAHVFEEIKEKLTPYMKDEE